MPFAKEHGAIQKRRANGLFCTENKDFRFPANQNINRSGANKQNKNITEIHRGSGEY